MKLSCALGASLLLLCGMPDVRAADSVEALSDMSLEELANLAITSVSGHSERLSGAAASIYVITADDIRRAGVTSLPEALPALIRRALCRSFQCRGTADC